MKRIIILLFVLSVFNGFSQTKPNVFLNYSSIVSDTILPGASLNSNYIIENIGDKITDVFSVEFFISEDTIYSSGDIFLGVQNNIILNVSQELTKTKILTIPDQIFSGKWNILFVANKNFSTIESDYSNNVSYNPIFVDVNPLSDLAVSDFFTTTDTAAVGSQIEVDFLLSNKGEVESGYNYAGVYVSIDSIFDSYDVLAYEQTFSNVYKGQIINNKIQFNLPFIRKYGDSYLLLQLDKNLDVFESDEENNFAFTKIFIEESPAPDLIVTEPNLTPLSITAGDDAGFSAIIKNIGLVDATFSNLGFYLSKDTEFDALDEKISIIFVNPVDNQGQISVAGTINIPISTTTGDWNVLFFIDSDYEIAETNELNNVNSVVIKVTEVPLPDLIIDNAVVPTDSIVAGEIFNVSLEIKNIGQADSYSNTLDVYISNDTIFSDNDLFISESSVPFLSANIGVDSKNLNIELPASTQKGIKYLFFYVDAGESVSERNENNNIEMQSINVKLPPLPDLTFVQYNINPSSVIAGENIEVSSVIENIGKAISTATDIAWYLSKDTILNIEANMFNSADIQLGTSNIGVLDISEISSPSKSLKIPIVSEFGQWYLLHVADYSETNIEISENNNVAFNNLNIEQPPLPDLLIVDYIAEPDTIVAGSNTNITGVLKNIGDGDSESSVVSYFLSEDTFYDENDSFLGLSNFGVITTIGIKDVDATVTIPYNTQKGFYYIILVADSENSNVEEDEDNNIVYIQVFINLPPLPDLVVNELLVLEKTIRAGTPLNFSFAVKNTGQANASASQISFILSRDTIPFNDEYEYETDSMGISSLVPDQIYTSSAISVTTSQYMSTGKWYLLLYVDAYNFIVESNDNNNIKFVELEILPPPLPDLMIKDLSTNPSIIKAGSSQNISYIIKNIGDDEAPASISGIYLSKDTILSTGYNSDDIYLESINESILQATIGLATVEEEIYFSYGLEPGNYYLFVLADFYNDLTEVDETNNTDFFPITITPADLPDFVIDNQGISPTEIEAGSKIALAFTVKNTGMVKSGVSTAAVFISTDTKFDWGIDELLSDFNVDSIEINQGKSFNGNPTIPYWWQTGTNYILFIADYYANVVEGNEDNNIEFIELTVKLPPLPDLWVKIENVAPDTIVAGKEINVSSIVKNTGSDTSNFTYLEYYISRDTIFSEDDISLNTFNDIPSLTQGIGQFAVNEKLTIPSYIWEGDYYLLFYVDRYEYNIELNEVNNISNYLIHVLDPALPDLTITDANITPTTQEAGQKVYYSMLVKNIGDTVATNFYTDVYLSEDDKYSYNDILLDYTYHDSLKVNFSINDSVIIPYNTVAGDYYMIMIADLDSVVREINEDNNSAFVQITVTDPPRPDLMVKSSEVFPKYADLNSESSFIYSSLELENGGSVDATNVYLGVYLSNDETIDNSDLFIDEFYVGNIASNQIINQVFNINIPEGLVDGTNYILYYIDHFDEIIETNEDNNVLAGEVITDYKVSDLAIFNHDLLPNVIYQGFSGLVGSRIQNINLGNSNYSSLNYYLSSDEVIDGKDNLLSSDYIDEMSMGQIMDIRNNIHIPESTPEGDYYLLLFADGNSDVSESNENNNVIIEELTVAKPMFPDLFVSGMEFENSIVILDEEIPFSYTFGNSGNVGSGEVSISYILSYDFYLDPEDELIGIKSIDTLAFGTQQTIIDTLILDNSTTPGYYYIFVSIDYEDHVFEISESNNYDMFELRVDEDYFPDLSFRDPTILTSVVNPGNKIDVSTYIENIGLIKAKNIQVHMFLSNFSETIELGDFFIDSLEANTEIMQNYSVTIPSGQSDGFYSLIGVVDYNNTIQEFNETNNTFEFYIEVTSEILADLTATNIKIEESYFSEGDELSFTYDLKNLTDVTVDEFQVKYLLTVDDNIYTDVIAVVDSATISTFNGLETREISETITLPATLADGNYYLLIWIDSKDLVVELDEYNNFKFQSIGINNSALADLTIKDLQLSNYDLNGRSKVTATAELMNIGNVGASNFKVSYYLSLNKTYEMSDVLIQEFSILGLTTNESRVIEHELQLIATSIEGAANIIVVVDESNAIDEIDETNNAEFVSINYTSINDLVKGNLKLYPNPANEKLFIDLDNNIIDGTLYIIDSKGNIVKSINNLVGDNLTVDIQDLSKGIYVVRIITDNRVYHQKVIKK